MKHRTIIRLRILPALLLLCFSVVAQQRQDTAIEQELALRISDGDDSSWEILAFQGGGGGTTNVRRLESWEPSDKEPPVVDIVFKIDREGAVVIAHLLLKLENEKEVKVGTYRLREDEAIKTEEMRKFGLVPLVLKVVKAKPSIKSPVPPVMPAVENKTKAVEVVSLYESPPPFDDSFQLSLRNVSNKTIIALDLFTPSADGNGGGGQRSQGDKDNPLMLPGGTSVIHLGISRRVRVTPNSYVTEAAPQQTFIIRTVVFADGSYDGLVEPAAEMEAERRGTDIQRRKILRLLQESEKTNDEDSLITLDELKEKAYALGKTADASVAQELSVRFPSLHTGWLLERIGGGLRVGKMELLYQINDFEEKQKQPGGHITFAEWLKHTKANYEKLTATP